MGWAGHNFFCWSQAMACGHGPVREFVFAGKETAQQDGSSSATSMWNVLGHSKKPCDRMRTFREHPDPTLAHVPLFLRVRSKPPAFPLSRAPPRATRLRVMLWRHRLDPNNISGHTRWECGQVWLRCLTCTVKHRIK